MRCAYGVPAHMIQVPVLFGLSERPVVFGSNGQVMIQQGVQCWAVPDVAQGSLALQSVELG